MKQIKRGSGLLAMAVVLLFLVMFRRLFGGGRAEITLADPENVLSSGIDIFAQPPGKKLISLTLLSGGERSMTAVALLFATYMVKPSPFCILDEIDAALDDKNIGFFLSVLDDFAKDSQLILMQHILLYLISISRSILPIVTHVRALHRVLPKKISASIRRRLSADSLMPSTSILLSVMVIRLLFIYTTICWITDMSMKLR